MLNLCSECGKPKDPEIQGMFGHERCKCDEIPVIQEDSTVNLECGVCGISEVVTASAATDIKDIDTTGEFRLVPGKTDEYFWVCKNCK